MKAFLVSNDFDGDVFFFFVVVAFADLAETAFAEDLLDFVAIVKVVAWGEFVVAAVVVESEVFLGMVGFGFV